MSYKVPVPTGVPLHSVGDTPAAPAATLVQSATDTPAGGRSHSYSRGESPALPQTPVAAPKDSFDTRIANLQGETPSALDAAAMQNRMLRPIPKADRYRLFYEAARGKRTP